MLSVVIQAGGESRRMGRDKGLALFLGQPLVQRLAQRLQPIADELLLTTNHPAAYAFLHLPLHSDVQPGRGALGGLYTALHAAQHAYVAVVACDMPFACPDLLVYLQQALEQSSADIAIPQRSDGFQPFHAVYRRAACLAAVAQAVQAGRWRVDAWFDQVQVQPVGEAILHGFSPDGRCFLNANTPEELAAAERLA